MRKTILTIVAILTLVLTPSLAFAQGVQQQDRVQDPSVHENVMTASQGNQMQNQDQVETQNKGEDQQLMVSTQQMQQLMDMQGLPEEVGNKIQTLAKEQVQAQTQIQTQLDKMDSKSKLMKALFGPDFAAINNLNQQIEQNRLRIEKLQQLQNEVTNEGDQTQLQEAIQALVDQNTSLQNQVTTEGKVKSLFGWLVKLFY